MTRILALCVTLGCTPAPSLQSSPTLQASATSPSEPACAASDDEVPIAPFISPIGGTEFRRATWTAAQSLRCCDPQEHFDAQRLTIEFTPESSELARARLWSASPPLDDAMATCVQAHLARWTMRPAPRSDIVRSRPSPFGPRYASSAGSVRVALPAFPAR